MGGTHEGFKVKLKVGIKQPCKYVDKLSVTLNQWSLVPMVHVFIDLIILGIGEWENFGKVKVI